MLSLLIHTACALESNFLYQLRAQREAASKKGNKKKNKKKKPQEEKILE